MAVRALLYCHEKPGKEHTKAEEPEGLPQKCPFGASNAENPVHAGSRTNSQEQGSIPRQWRQENGKGKQTAKQGTDKAAGNAARRVRQARCATQEKIVDAEVEEQQDIQIDGLHVHHRLFFDYSIPPVQMLSKGRNQIEFHFLLTTASNRRNNIKFYFLFHAHLIDRSQLHGKIETIKS